MGAPNGLTLSEEQISIFRVANICCKKEIDLVYSVLDKTPGLLSCEANSVTKTVFVRHNPNKLTVSDILEKLNAVHLGATISETGVFDGSAVEQKSYWQLHKALLPDLLIISMFIIICAITLTSNDSSKSALSNIINIILALLASSRLLMTAYTSIFKLGSGNMQVLMAVGVIAAIAKSEIVEAVLIPVSLSLANIASHFINIKLESSIASIVCSSPPLVRVREELTSFNTKLVPAEQIKQGDIIAIFTGETIPVDGTVINGAAQVDESKLTGEPVPQLRSIDSYVAMGSVVINGTIDIVALCNIKNSSANRLAESVRLAQSNVEDTSISRSVDSFASIFLPIIFITALVWGLLPFISDNVLKSLGLYNLSFTVTLEKTDDPITSKFLLGFYKFIDEFLFILVAACPCAVVMAAPATFLAAIAFAAKKLKAIIRGGIALECIGNTCIAAFDKTGTLTKGQFGVVSEMFAEEWIPRSLIKKSKKVNDSKQCKSKNCDDAKCGSTNDKNAIDNKESTHNHTNKNTKASCNNDHKHNHDHTHENKNEHKHEHKKGEKCNHTHSKDTHSHSHSNSLSHSHVHTEHSHDNEKNTHPHSHDSHNHSSIDSTDIKKCAHKHENGKKCGTTNVSNNTKAECNKEKTFENNHKHSGDSVEHTHTHTKGCCSGIIDCAEASVKIMIDANANNTCCNDTSCAANYDDLTCIEGCCTLPPVPDNLMEEKLACCLNMNDSYVQSSVISPKKHHSYHLNAYRRCRRIEEPYTKLELDNLKKVTLLGVRGVSRLAAAVESRAAHPLAALLTTRWTGGCVGDYVATNSSKEDNEMPDIKDFVQIPGKGVEANVKTPEFIINELKSMNIENVNEYSNVVVGNALLMADANVRLPITVVEWLEGHRSSLSPYDKSNPKSATNIFDKSLSYSSVVFVAVDKVLAMVLKVSDIVRPTAKSTISELKSLHISSLVLTGDSARSAECFQNEIQELSFAVGGLSPLDKRECILALQKIASAAANLYLSTKDKLNKKKRFFSIVKDENKNKNKYNCKESCPLKVPLLNNKVKSSNKIEDLENSNNNTDIVISRTRIKTNANKNSYYTPLNGAQNFDDIESGDQVSLNSDKVNNDNTYEELEGTNNNTLKSSSNYPDVSPVVLVIPVPTNNEQVKCCPHCNHPAVSQSSDAVSKFSGQKSQYVCGCRIRLLGDNNTKAWCTCTILWSSIIPKDIFQDDKERVKQIANGKTGIMMIGDGINDAPALSTVSASIAVVSDDDKGNGSVKHLSMEAASCLLLGCAIENIPVLIRLSRHCQMRVFICLMYAVLLKLFGILYVVIMSIMGLKQGNDLFIAILIDVISVLGVLFIALIPFDRWTLNVKKNV